MLLLKVVISQQPLCSFIYLNPLAKSRQYAESESPKGAGAASCKQRSPGETSMKTSAAEPSSISRQIESNRAVPRDVRDGNLFYR